MIVILGVVKGRCCVTYWSYSVFLTVLESVSCACMGGSLSWVPTCPILMCCHDNAEGSIAGGASPLAVGVF